MLDAPVAGYQGVDNLSDNPPQAHSMRDCCLRLFFACLCLLWVIFYAKSIAEFILGSSGMDFSDAKRYNVSIICMKKVKVHDDSGKRSG